MAPLRDEPSPEFDGCDGPAANSDGRPDEEPDPDGPDCDPCSPCEEELPGIPRPGIPPGGRLMMKRGGGGPSFGGRLTGRRARRLQVTED